MGELLETGRAQFYGFANRLVQNARVPLEALGDHVRVIEPGFGARLLEQSRHL